MVSMQDMDDLQTELHFGSEIDDEEFAELSDDVQFEFIYFYVLELDCSIDILLHIEESQLAFHFCYFVVDFDLPLALHFLYFLLTFPRG